MLNNENTPENLTNYIKPLFFKSSIIGPSILQKRSKCSKYSAEWTLQKEGISAMRFPLFFYLYI